MKRRRNYSGQNTKCTYLKYSKVDENQHCALDTYVLEKRSLLQCTTLFIQKSCADPCQIRYSISKSTSDACRCRRRRLGHNGASISGVAFELFVWYEVQALCPSCIHGGSCVLICVRYSIYKSTSYECHCCRHCLGVLPPDTMGPVFLESHLNWLFDSGSLAILHTIMEALVCFVR